MRNSRAGIRIYADNDCCCLVAIERFDQIEMATIHYMSGWWIFRSYRTVLPALEFWNVVQFPITLVCMLRKGKWGWRWTFHQSRWRQWPGYVRRIVDIGNWHRKQCNVRRRFLKEMLRFPDYFPIWFLHCPKPRQRQQRNVNKARNCSCMPPGLLRRVVGRNCWVRWRCNSHSLLEGGWFSLRCDCDKRWVPQTYELYLISPCKCTIYMTDRAVTSVKQALGEVGLVCVSDCMLCSAFVKRSLQIHLQMTFFLRKDILFGADFFDMWWISYLCMRIRDMYKSRSERRSAQRRNLWKEKLENLKSCVIALVAIKQWEMVPCASTWIWN